MVGTVSIQRLFAGSKSEGLYPVFDAEDGTRFRLRVCDMPDDGSDPLSSFYGLKVRVHGETDRMRGHWRLTLHGGPEGLGGIELLSIDPTDEV